MKSSLNFHRLPPAALPTAAAAVLLVTLTSCPLPPLSHHLSLPTHTNTYTVQVLYPQAIATALNPKGCFDWWGYTSPAYASKLGLQVAGVHGMVTALTKSP